MSKRILVVEDQPDNRQIIRDMLAPTDYEITEAEDGEQRKSRINSPPDRPVITPPVISPVIVTSRCHNLRS